MSNKVYLWSVVGAFVVGLVLGSFLFAPSKQLGGLVHVTQEIFRNGLKAGTDATLVINGSGEWAGTINTTANATLAGSNTLSGANTVSGASTFTGNIDYHKSASTTLYIGGADWTGCIALGDASAATSTNIVYITATGSTISATTTKPAICR